MCVCFSSLLVRFTRPIVPLFNLCRTCRENMPGALRSSAIVLILSSLFHVSQASHKGPPGVVTTALQSQYTGKIGENFRFVCPIRADPEPIFEWYRDGIRIAEHWERYKFLNKGNVLSIQHLECEDEATYTCKGINGFGVEQINFQLMLLDGSLREVCKEASEEDNWLGKPVILHKPKKPKRWLKPARNYASLRCTAIGDPVPRLQWFKDGMEIPQDKNSLSSSSRYVIRSTVLGEDDLESSHATEGMRSTLQISDLRGSDTANYTCRALNEHGSDELTQMLDVVEPQTPQRPEFRLEHPPSNTYVEVGQGASLSCKVYSDFPPEIHWLKRITSSTPGAFLSQPRLPSDEEVESIQPQFVPNGTITIGDVKYQILPSAPASYTNDGYVSILLLPKRLQESDAGYYICLAFNSAGYNFRQAYLNVTRGRNLPLFADDDDDDYYPNKHDEHWNSDKNRNEATTTAVVVVTVVICGIAGMIVSCFVWKRRKNHLRDKTLSLPSGLPSSTHLSLQQPFPFDNPAPPTNYIAFREGLTNSSFGTPSPNLASSRSNNPLDRTYFYQLERPGYVQQSRNSSAAAVDSPRQHKLTVYPSRTICANGYKSSNNSSRTSQHARQSPKTGRRLHSYISPSYHQEDALESRSLTNDSSYVSEPRHTRLPYPSPETSFD